MRRKKLITYFLTVFLLIGLYGIILFLNRQGIVNRYSLTVLRMVCINIILATSLNITVGNLGQITLGHAGFMSIGAYSATLFVKSGLVPGMGGYILSLILGGLIALIIGIIIGLPALRLKGDYLAIVTLAFGEIIRVLIEYFSFTGGAQGLSGIPTMKSFDFIYVIMCICVALMYSVMTSRHGRAVLSIREDEIASEASGINVTYYKTFAFGLSAFFAGVAGAIYAQNIGVIDAKVFDYNKSFDILVMVVLGGMGSFTGSVISATVLTVIPEVLRSFASYRMIIYSLVLILMMIFKPEGLLGRKEFSIHKIAEIMTSGDKKNKFFKRKGDQNDE
ncbi:branched-chain amino acid ABC transporter permease [Peptoniphilus raoultii]|uniref:branched-chain amino acid ABC transporter permease n=1 Tax=Peptoniphilus raoultii TaxID=1776387 RepID=UPI0008DB0884|nr:branched-chain amino acid ABC transporter permease [Peptoniphilus raoultii]